jgi:hypothetical protein
VDETKGYHAGGAGICEAGFVDAETRSSSCFGHRYIFLIPTNLNMYSWSKRFSDTLQSIIICHGTHYTRLLFDRRRSSLDMRNINRPVQLYPALLGACDQHLHPITGAPD